MTERQADHSIACGVFTNDDGRCTCKEDSSAATTESRRWVGPFPGRFVVLHDLDTEDFLPLGVLFEERDGTGTLRIFEDAEARDPHLSKMRREFESFEEAVSSWNRSALISTYTRIGACDVTI